VVTSPPYDNIRAYGEAFDGLDWKPVFQAFPEILNPGGVVVWNVADQVVNGSETGTSFRQALWAMDCGLRLHDTMIYCKEGVTFPDNNRYHPAFEYVFVFSAGAPKHFNGIKDWKNKSAGRSSLGSTQRQPDGSTRETSSSVKLSITPEYSLRRNWWIVANPYNGETAGHPAPMPFTLVSDHIETWTKQGSIVADPFMGSGTTGVAAVKLGRKFIGIEIEPKYFDIACKRIQAALDAPDLFIEAPKPAKQEELL
jgi:site-specific DNA-methyltransferase (adenine-specific)